jgi:hypothetical protein
MSTNKNSKAGTPSKTADKAPLFTRKNYMLTIISAAVVCLGFILMYGKEDIYDFRKITLAPIVVMIGFAIGGYAIFYRDKTEKKED